MTSINSPSGGRSSTHGRLSVQRDDRLLEAREAVLNDRFDTAMQICEAEIRPEERDQKWLLLRAQARVGLGQGLLALDDLFQVLRDHPDQAEAFFRIGQIFLEVDEAGHAERYLQRAVEISGGKKSYEKLHRQAHKRALREDSRLDAPQSSLPSAEDAPGLNEPAPGSGPDSGQILDALDHLFAFEQETRLFASRLDNALSLTRDALPKFKAVGSSQKVKRSLLYALAGGAGLMLLIGAGIFTLRAWHQREAFQSQIALLDLAIEQGSQKARQKASGMLQDGADFDDESLALRSAWLAISTYDHDSGDPKDLQRALDLLAPYAESDAPLAVLGRGYTNLAQGLGPGAEILTQKQDEAEFESLRQELLAYDALAKRAYDSALRSVAQALQERPKNLDLHNLAATICIRSQDLKKAATWIAKAFKLDAPKGLLALYQANLQWAQGELPAQVAKTLRPSLDSPAWRVRLASAVLAVELRAALGTPDQPAPNIDDIVSLVDKDPSRAHLAAWLLIENGWQSLAAQVLKSADVTANADEHFAQIAARGDLEKAQKAASAAGLRSAFFSVDLALRAASQGEINLTEALITHMEILGMAPCELAATRARVSLRRGLPLDAKTKTSVDTCAQAGSMLLFAAERGAFGQRRAKAQKGSATADAAPKPLKTKALRLALSRSRALAGQRFVALGLMDLQHAQPLRTHEAGRLLAQRCPLSRTATALRLRAAMAQGDFPAMEKLYKAQDEDSQGDPELVGLLAWGRLSRGEDRGVKKFLARTELAQNPKGQAWILAAMQVSTVNKRKAKQALEAMAKADPSPYILEAMARIYTVMGQEAAAAKALDAIHGAPERSLYRTMLRAYLALARGDQRDYRRQLKAAGKKAQQDFNNQPIVAEAAMRIAVLRSDKNSRRNAIDEAQQALDDLGSYDRRAPYLRDLSRLGRRYRNKAQEIKP